MRTEHAFPREELDPGQHRRALLALADDLGTRLRTSNQIAQGLTCTIHYADQTATRRSRTLPEATHHTVLLARTAYALYESSGSSAPGSAASRCAPTLSSPQSHPAAHPRHRRRQAPRDRSRRRPRPGPLRAQCALPGGPCKHSAHAHSWRPRRARLRAAAARRGQPTYLRPTRQRRSGSPIAVEEGGAASVAVGTLQGIHRLDWATNWLGKIAETVDDRDVLAIHRLGGELRPSHPWACLGSPGPVGWPDGAGSDPRSHSCAPCLPVIAGPLRRTGT
ncbi:hypothetical protein [Streptomyces sp. NPDC058086]|uniref:DinB/UmuC family translesion DNA polymerase n=1 Tax=Streptomyces sp. NPDC058086 TaxID=3346334 RepID=UPI0036EB58E1